jgi:hypothetical protein
MVGERGPGHPHRHLDLAGRDLALGAHEDEEHLEAAQVGEVSSGHFETDTATAEAGEGAVRPRARYSVFAARRGTVMRARSAAPRHRARRAPFRPAFPS